MWIVQSVRKVTVQYTQLSTRGDLSCTRSASIANVASPHCQYWQCYATTLPVLPRRTLLLQTLWQCEIQESAYLKKLLQSPQLS
jgi:hypothetical protein